MKKIRKSLIAVLSVSLMLILFSGIVMHHNIRNINQKLNQRLENALKLGEIALPQAVWQVNEEDVRHFINAMFLEENIVYVQVRILLTDQKVSIVKAHPGFDRKPFSFFQESPQFITGSHDIFYEGQKGGTIDIAVLRKGIYRELISSTLSAIALMSAVISLIIFYYIRLRQSEKKYRDLYDNAVEGVFQSVPGKGYISVNPAYAKILGYDSPKELIDSVNDIGKQQYVNPEDREKLIQIIMEKGRAEGFETRLYRKDRSIIWISVYTRGVPDNQGNILYYEGSVVDITGRKHAELELKKHQEHLEEMVEKRTSQLRESLRETCIARKAAEEANKKITDSISYAKMIQRSLLANLDVVKMYLPDSFFIWEPRDIVGGDIFYTDSFDDGFIIAVIDCTGHGVPGAFMTMIVMSSLKRTVKDEGCHDPAEILKRLNRIVKTTLQQDTDYAVSDDGLEIGVCFVQKNLEGFQNLQGFSLTFAGARLPLYYVRDGEVNLIKGDRQNLGYVRSDVNFSFTNHKVDIEKGMSFYMATDGFADQMGEDGRRFGTARLKNLLKEIYAEPFEKQRSILMNAFEIHKGGHERRDDMTVVGFGF